LADSGYSAVNIIAASTGPAASSAPASFYHYDGHGRAVDIAIASNIGQTDMDAISRDVGQELLGRSNPPR
jgi:hypothetical protein